jgi:hypothetical protein
MSPSDKVAQLYPQAPGSLFDAFYDSHGYDGGILTRLHTGSNLKSYYIFDILWILASSKPSEPTTSYFKYSM